MIRAIVLFCISFLLSIGILAALYGAYHLSVSSNEDKGESVVQTADPEDASKPDEKESGTQSGQKDEEKTTEETEDTDTTAGEEPQQQEPVKPATPEERERQVVSDVETALKSEDPAAAIDQLVQDNKITGEAADALKKWRENHEPGGLEHVGTIRPAGSDKDLSRWRLKSANGGEDLLLDVEVAEDGSMRIVAVTPTPSDKTQVSAVSDSVTVAEGFIEAVRHGDMWTARGMITGDEVSDATIAGLCMIFEEGCFTLREKAPLRHSFENETNAGFFVYLVPTGGQGKTSNIGLELVKGDMWKICGVSFDSLLASYAELGEAEGGHYFPIVKNPKGGDSLALFFPFDQAELSPRSLKQLQIVAELLKKSDGKLDISGHTDDVGSEQYNQKLSERRAASVKNALVSFGVREDQITTTGMGKSQPRRLPQNARTEDDVQYIRGENRRAEIYLDFVHPDAQ